MFYTIVKYIAKLYLIIFYRVKVYNADSFNKIEGGCILCCNHTSNLDPVVLACYTKRTVNFMAKKELFEIPFVKYFIKGLQAFPVDRTGVTLSAIKNAIEILKKGKVMGIFPEGTRVHEFNENNAKPGVAMIAKMAQVPVVPVYINSTYKLFSKVEIIYGEPTDYFSSIEGKITSEQYNVIGKKILTDIYSLKDKHNK